MSKRVETAPFTKEMAAEYTILIPNMIEIHFEMIREIFNQEGYHAELLKTEGPSIAKCGLKYVHNDTCYPALLVIGQMIEALQSGKYDIHKVALILPQTAGGCRASNYISLLRKALRDANLGFVPVLSLNLNKMEQQDGFKLTIGLLYKFLACVAYGDLLMLLSNQTRPYELKSGTSNQLVDEWTKNICAQFQKGKGLTLLALRRNFQKITADFASIERSSSNKIRTGIVGEIYVKYAPMANNRLLQFLESQNCEVMVPGLMQFLLYAADMPIEDTRLYGGSRAKMGMSLMMYRFLARYEKVLIETVQEAGCFTVPASYLELKQLARNHIGTGCKMGEGWLLTAEMCELCEKGYENIVCTQPFGCLPNHIAGKAMMHKLREYYPQSNIIAVDYDPGASLVNQENRIKLMLSIAREHQQPDPIQNRISAQDSDKRNAALLDQAFAQ